VRSTLTTFALILTLLGITLLYGYHLGKLRKEFMYSDYGKFYKSAQFMLQGKNPYTTIYFYSEPTKEKPKPELQHLGANLNPPFFNLIAMPLALVKYPTSFLIWEAVMVGCGFFSIILLQRGLNLPATINATLALTIALFLYYPTFANFWLGQISIFLLPCIIGAWIAERQGKYWLSGLLLGFATSIKLFFGLFFIYYLIRREWRGFFWFTSTILICALLPLILYDKSFYTRYDAMLQQIVWFSSGWNASLLGLFTRLFGNGEHNIPLWPIKGLTPILHKLCSGLLILLTVKLLWPDRRIDPSNKINLDFSMILMVMLLISPLGWMYYFPYLLIPVVVLLNLAHKGYHPYLIRILTCIAIALTSTPLYLRIPQYTSNFTSTISFSACYTIGLFLLIGLLFFARHALLHPHLPLKDTCSKSLAYTLYASALLPSFAGMLGAMHYSIIYGTESFLNVSHMFYGS